MTPDLNIFETIKKQRQAAGISQAALASQAGLSRNTYRKLKDGQGTIQNLQSVLSILNLNLKISTVSRHTWPRSAPLKVLSLFDGISCGAVALKNLGFQNVTYYASEIEDTAVRISQHNFPDAVQLGDVTNITDEQIRRLGPFDLVLAGSPCQDLAKGKDKQGFTGERSALFSEFVRLLNACKRYNPQVKFLFENVAAMSKVQQSAVNQMLGCDPIKINSALVSAQHRQRLYWMNFQTEEIEDREITLGSILSGKDETYPSNCSLTLSEDAMTVHIDYDGQHSEQLADNFFTRNKPTYKREHVITDVRTSVMKSNGITSASLSTGGDGSTSIVYSKPSTAKQRERILGVSRSTNGKAAPLMTVGGNGLGCAGSTTIPFEKNNVIGVRPLNITELERLQTLPVGYTAVPGISKSRRGFHIGNGWTVAVIEELLSCLPYGK